MSVMSMLCYACRQPLLDEQPYTRVFSAELPYRHTDPDHCPALRAQEQTPPEADGGPGERHLRAI